MLSCSWHFCANFERDAFIRLDTNSQAIRHQPTNFRGFVELVWYALKLNSYFCAAFGQAFASTDIEGNISPAPIFNIELESHERFCHRVGIDPFLLFIALNMLTSDLTGGILSTH